MRHVFFRSYHTSDEIREKSQRFRLRYLVRNMKMFNDTVYMLVVKQTPEKRPFKIAQVFRLSVRVKLLETDYRL